MIMTTTRRNAVHQYLINRGEATRNQPQNETMQAALEASLRYWEVHGKLPPTARGTMWITLERELNRLAGEDD